VYLIKLKINFKILKKSSNAFNNPSKINKLAPLDYFTIRKTIQLLEFL